MVHFCLSLSFPLLLLAVWCDSNLAHTIAGVRFCLSLSFPLLLLAVWCDGNLAHTVAMVRFCLSLPLLVLSLVGYDIGIRKELPLALGTFYLFSYRTVGLRINGNPCPCLLSPTAPAPRTRCLGWSVTRFQRPFESQPADPLRRVLFQQLALQPCNSGWFAPTAANIATPRPLERAEEPSSAHRKGFRCRRRLQF